MYKKRNSNSRGIENREELKEILRSYFERPYNKNGKIVEKEEEKEQQLTNKEEKDMYWGWEFEKSLKEMKGMKSTEKINAACALGKHCCIIAWKQYAIGKRHQQIGRKV